MLSFSFLAELESNLMNLRHCKLLVHKRRFNDFVVSNFHVLSLVTAHFEIQCTWASRDASEVAAYNAMLLPPLQFLMRHS